jgi:hypothetical protein
MQISTDLDQKVTPINMLKNASSKGADPNRMNRLILLTQTNF